MTRGVHAAIGLAIAFGGLAYLGLHVVEPPGSLTWAYAHLNRLPLAGFLAIGLALVLPLAALGWRRLPLAARDVPALSGKVGVLAALALGALFLALGWFSPARAVSLDATAFAVEVWKGTIYTTRWYLTLMTYTALLRPIEWVAPFPVPARDVVSVVNTFVCGASYVLLFACARRLGRTFFDVGVLVALAWTAFGNLQLVFYYMDIYPVVQFAFALFLWVSLRVLDDEGTPLWPVVIVMVGPFFYVGLILLAPALLITFLATLRRGGGTKRLVICLAVGLVLAALATWPGYGQPLAFWAHAEALLEDSGRHLGLSNGSSFLPPAYALSFEHLREFLHTLLLIDGLGVWLCVTAGIPLLLAFLRGSVVSAAGLLLLMTAPVLAYAFWMDPLWGVYADWDLFSYAAVPTSLLGGYGFVLWSRRTPRAGALLFGLLLAGSLVHLAARLNALEIDMARHRAESPSHIQDVLIQNPAPDTDVGLGPGGTRGVR